MELKKLKVAELKTIIKNYKSKQKLLVTGKKKGQLIEMINGLNLSDEELNQLKVKVPRPPRAPKPSKKEEPPKEEDVKTEVNPLFQDKKPSSIKMEKSKVIKKSGSTIRKKEVPPIVMEKSKVIKKKGTSIRKKGAPKEEDKKSKVSSVERVAKEIKEEKAQVFKLIDRYKKIMSKQALDKYVTQLEEIYDEATPQITSSGQKLSNLKSALIKYLDSRERQNKKK
tara:strand:- start:20 stop:694 length:675 start_codon:yes stop_codon:yes gene_type:complete